MLFLSLELDQKHLGFGRFALIVTRTSPHRRQLIAGFVVVDELLISLLCAKTDLVDLSCTTRR
jgi:hypothetical protein